ncbi:MAG: hypothetical protein LBC95_01950 [Candidatus Nomurabacteria bacterium]|jgi:hypothetical protein|nr:hypothetical protein [Candidatus Nomurabacteria bacterium]
MDGKSWEIKCPTSGKMDKIRRNISGALKQSQNIIIGTFNTDIPDDKIIRYCQKYSTINKSIKKLIVITKHKQIIDIK